MPRDPRTFAPGALPLAGAALLLALAAGRAAAQPLPPGLPPAPVGDEPKAKALPKCATIEIVSEEPAKVKGGNDEFLLLKGKPLVLVGKDDEISVYDNNNAFAKQFAETYGPDYSDGPIATVTYYPLDDTLGDDGPSETTMIMGVSNQKQVDGLSKLRLTTMGLTPPAGKFQALVSFDTPCNTPPPLPYATVPKPLYPMCKALSDYALAFGKDYEGTDLKDFCKSIPNCFVTYDDEYLKGGRDFACVSQMDICLNIADEGVCNRNELCEWSGNACVDPTTWGPLDIAVNWLQAVNAGEDACKDVAGLFQKKNNPSGSPPLLLGTVGSPGLNEAAGYDEARDEIEFYFCESFLPNAPDAFVCGVNKFDGICEAPLADNPGPLSRGYPHYSVLLGSGFEKGRVLLGAEPLGFPTSAVTISGNWGFTYNAGPNAGNEYIARFTFIIQPSGYIQTLHSDFVPGTKTSYPVPN